MEEIEVEVVHDGPPAAEPDGPRFDWRRWLVPLCAVVVAGAAVVVAWSQVRQAALAERTVCMQEAQVRTFFDRRVLDDERYSELVAECGIEQGD